MKTNRDGIISFTKQCVAHVLTTYLMVILLVFGGLEQLLTPKPKPQIETEKPTKVSDDIQDYIRAYGFGVQKHLVTTRDGFVLPVYHLTPDKSKPLVPSLGPILLVHGLFQDSGVFVTSGANSIAFYLARAGYDVWLGNNRCSELVTSKASLKNHVSLSPSSLQFWDWSVHELGKYDFPALVDFVYRSCGSRQRIVYVGHSQGNAQAFLSLSYFQEGAQVMPYIKCLVALAPAVYFGPLLKQYPVALLMNCHPTLYHIIFGRKQILPVTDPVQAYFPPRLFTSLAYTMFHYLFKWTDTNWSKVRKDHYFRFTPKPTSCKSILHWAQMAHLGHVAPFDSSYPSPSQIAKSKSSKLAHAVLSQGEEPLHPVDLTIDRIHVPLVLFYGRKDLIVDGDRLERTCRQLNMNVIYSEHVQDYEHMDVIWATSAPDRVFAKILKALESL